MMFDENTTVNANELLKLVESSYYAITYLHEGTVKNAYGMTYADFKRVLENMALIGLKQKVISALEHCVKVGEESCEDCPYFAHDFCTNSLKHDVLKVLK